METIVKVNVAPGLRAYAAGRSDEREQWLGLAGELRARVLNKHQSGGSLTLTLEDVLALSCELARAEGRRV